MWNDNPQANIRIGRGGYTAMHEYGHYLQSQKSGPLYLLKYGVPSGPGDADWTEIDANTRAATYFNRIDPTFTWQLLQNNRYYMLANNVQNPRWFEYPLSQSSIGITLILFKNWKLPW